jgi:hypothetical protein
MAPSNVANRLYKLREHWVKNTPVETYNYAGPWLMELSKMIDSDWQGDGIAKLPVEDLLSTNGGPNFVLANTNTVNGGGSRYDVPAREFHIFHKISQYLISLTNQGKSLVGDNLTALMDDMLRLEQSAKRILSRQIWSDGTGRSMLGNGSWLVSGNAVVVQNKASLLSIEPGSVLVAIDPAAPIPAGGQPTPRNAAGTNYKVTVASVDEASLTFTTVEADISAAITGVTNADYWGLAVDFDDASSDDYRGLIDGFFRWVPFTKTEAITTLFGYDRSVNPTRRSGVRVLVEPGDSTFDVFAKMMSATPGTGASGKVNRLYVTREENRRLMNELRANSYHIVKTETKTDPVNQRIGFTAAEVVGPDFAGMIICDPYMFDPSLPTDQDRTMVGLVAEDWSISTTDGLGWKAYGDDGTLRSTSGSKSLEQQYGMYGNLICRGAGRQVVASTRAND